MSKIMIFKDSYMKYLFLFLLFFSSFHLGQMSMVVAYGVADHVNIGNDKVILTIIVAILSGIMAVDNEKVIDFCVKKILKYINKL